MRLVSIQFGSSSLQLNTHTFTNLAYQIISATKKVRSMSYILVVLFAWSTIFSVTFLKLVSAASHSLKCRLEINKPICNVSYRIVLLKSRYTMNRINLRTINNQPQKRIFLHSKYSLNGNETPRNLSSCSILLFLFKNALRK